MTRLLLFRHAKAAAYAGGGDHDRPLTARGVKDAERIGRFIAKENLLPGCVLVSDARRTRETLDAAARLWPTQPERRDEERLYLAWPQRILEIVRGANATAPLMVIGHNPGLGELANTLVAAGDSRARQAMAERFPTAALAVLDFDMRDWPDIRAASATLVRFVTPADLGGDVA